MFRTTILWLTSIALLTSGCTPEECDAVSPGIWIEFTDGGGEAVIVDELEVIGPEGTWSCGPCAATEIWEMGEHTIVASVGSCEQIVTVFSRPETGCDAGAESQILEFAFAESCFE